MTVNFKEKFSCIFLSVPIQLGRGKFASDLFFPMGGKIEFWINSNEWNVMLLPYLIVWYCEETLLSFLHFKIISPIVINLYDFLVFQLN